MNPLVSCLTATYGRYTVLQDAVTCFLEQDYDNKELVILNNHPVPLHADFPQVRIINEPGHQTLGDCRNRLLGEAKGEFIRTWDDDDLYLPWAISQGVKMIPDNAPAWKPLRSWSWRPDKKLLRLNGNVYEASWTTRASVVKECGYLGKSGGNEHATLKKAVQEAGGIAKTDCGDRASYVYVWGNGLCHISGSLGDERGVEWRTNRWMMKNDDHGEEVPMKRTDLKKYWDMIEEKIKEGM